MPTSGLDLKLERVRAGLTLTELSEHLKRTGRPLSRQSLSVIEARAVVDPKRAALYLTALREVVDAKEAPAA